MTFYRPHFDPVSRGERDRHGHGRHGHRNGCARVRECMGEGVNGCAPATPSSSADDSRGPACSNAELGAVPSNRWLPRRCVLHRTEAELRRRLEHHPCQAERHTELPPVPRHSSAPARHGRCSIRRPCSVRRSARRSVGRRTRTSPPRRPHAVLRPRSATARATSPPHRTDGRRNEHTRRPHDLCAHSCGSALAGAGSSARRFGLRWSSRRTLS